MRHRLRAGIRATAVAGLAAWLVGCAHAPVAEPAPVPDEAAVAAGGLLVYGPERLLTDYDDPLDAPKRVLLDRINRDRAAAGAPALQWDPRAARVGDAFCLDSALAGGFSHRDSRGRAPYLRWGAAGGADYHTENFAARSDSSGSFAAGVEELLLDAHTAMMAERPPDDGHRRTLLDPGLTHLGIGVAVVAGEFRMSEEFTRVAFEWVGAPTGPLRPGDVAAVAGRPAPGFRLGLIEVRFEPPARPPTPWQLRDARPYAYPDVLATLWPSLPRGLAYPDGRRPDFRVAPDGRFVARFPLDAGPGHYFVLAYVRDEAHPSEPWRPATAILIAAPP